MVAQSCCICAVFELQISSGTCRLPIRRSPSKLCAILVVSRKLRMDGVLHLASPDPPIGRNTPLPVEAACVSEQADDQTLLRVDSINKQYADQVVLANVAFDIQAGEIVGIIGPNGAGKTTVVCTENLSSGVVVMKSA